MTTFDWNQRTTGATTRWLLVWAAALVCAAVPRPVAAETFNVPAGNVNELIAAVQAAESNSEADTIILAGGTYTITQPYVVGVEAGLPVIGSTITIEGNGSIIERSSAPGTPDFRIFVALDAGGQLTLNDLTVRNGHVGSTLRGGGILNLSGTVMLTRTTVSGNSAGQGGGIWNDGTLVITRSTISGNSATDPNNGDGGGIYNVGSLTISQSTLAGNQSSNAFGGGIFSDGTVEIAHSTLAGNQSPSNRGGGIFVAGGSLTLTNSTLSDNVAGFTGGGIFVAAATVTLTNSTLAGNSAGPDGGGGLFAGSGSSTSLTNSIFANSSGFNCSVTASISSFFSDGNNLATDSSCPGFTQVTSGQLNLGPLFPNGGPTWTHALLAGSLAIDAGDQGECADHEILTDQRGFARDSHCDIGAFEFGAGPRADLLISQAVDKISVKQGDTLTYFISVQNFGPDTAPNVVVTDTLSSGTTFLSIRVNKGTYTAPPVGNTGTVTWYLGDLVDSSSETAQLAVTVLVKGKTTITNTATVSADVVDPNPANNSAAIMVSVAAGSAGNRKPK